MQYIVQWVRTTCRRVVCALVWSVLLVLSACGGGGGGTSSVTTVASFPASAASQFDPNVAVITVEQGPGNNVNIPYVTVTVMPAGTSTCKDIDHVLLDTGSTGLRLFTSTLTSTTPTLTLPPHQVGADSTIYECAQFLNYKAWGKVKVADVVIGSKRTSVPVPVHLMDSSYPTVLDSTCGTARLMTTLRASANGILGVGMFAHDGQSYFKCTTSASCQISVPVNQQVQNPVALFNAENNGVIVQLPALPSTGVSKASGYLIFGIDTLGNNTLSSAKVVEVNAAGYFTTHYKDHDRVDSFIDSGSNGLYFDDIDLSTACNTAALGFYCPTTAQDLSADIQLNSTTRATVNFSIASADTLFQSTSYAFNNMGGTLDYTTFDWGLPFFFGRSVYTAIEGKAVGSRMGKFFAFTN